MARTLSLKMSWKSPGKWSLEKSGSRVVCTTRTFLLMASPVGLAVLKTLRSKMSVSIQSTLVQHSLYVWVCLCVCESEVQYSMSEAYCVGIVRIKLEVCASLLGLLTAGNLSLSPSASLPSPSSLSHLLHAGFICSATSIKGSLTKLNFIWIHLNRLLSHTSWPALL